MLNFIQTSGLFFWPILGLLLLIVGLAIRCARDLRRPAREPGLGSRINGLLFWGALAVVLGVLGQSTGIYNALQAISRATEISPQVVAAGLAESFSTTLFGLGVLAFAGLAWAVLQIARRRGPRAAAGTAACLLAGLLLAGAASAGEDLTDGGWAAAAGADRFVFVFTEATEGPPTGMSHSLRDGRQYTQCPFTVDRYEHPDLEFTMAGTGVRYRGRVDLDAGRIDGGLVYGEDEGMDFDLVRIDPLAEPGYAARTGTTPYVYAPPPTLDDGWPTAAASDQGLAPQVLEDVVAAVTDGRAGLLHSVLVVRGGRLILEEYFHGYERGDLHPQASVTKSVSSLLVGVALGRGEIEDLQTPLLDYFPGAEPADDRWRAVTLAHLLTMSMGLDWSDEEVDRLHGTGPEFFAEVLGRGFITEPGAAFRYASANVNLLSGVIKETTDLFPDQYAAQHLFAPLGITDWNWDYGAKGGHRLMDGSLQLRPRDMARIGQMMLAGGRWQEQQVLPEEFVRAALSHRVDTEDPPDRHHGYGYLWWTRKVEGANGPIEIAFANGWGSQFIFVAPDLDLVVVTTGGNQDNGLHMAPLAVVGLPLLQGMGALQPPAP